MEQAPRKMYNAQRLLLAIFFFNYLVFCSSSVAIVFLTSGERNECSEWKDYLQHMNLHQPVIRLFCLYRARSRVGTRKVEKK